MQAKEEKFLKEITDEDIMEAYQGIIDINNDSHAMFIIGLMISTLKRYKSIYIKNLVYVFKNFLAYKYNSFMDTNCKDVDLDEIFKKIRKFLRKFHEMLEEFKYLLNNNIYSPTETADMYLYYFTLLTIYNRIMGNFNSELKRATIETMAFSVELPSEKNIDENMHDFQEVLKLVKEFKLKKEDKN